MKEIGFMAVVTVVSAIAARFFSDAPGMLSWIVFVGTAAAIAGGILAIFAQHASRGKTIAFVFIALAILVIAVIAYRTILAGEPGNSAANMLLVATAAVYGPVGFFIELGGLKWT